jgi:hypothetical protein
MKRPLIVVAVLATVGLLLTQAAYATWSGSAAGAGAKGGGLTLAKPTNVRITACTATGKSGQNITATLTVTWTVSTDAKIIGERVMIGDTATPANYSTTLATFAGNTTASSSPPPFTVAANTYTIGIRGTTATNWVATGGSNNTFTLSTAGSNGTCTRT